MFSLVKILLYHQLNAVPAVNILASNHLTDTVIGGNVAIIKRLVSTLKGALIPSL